MLWRILLTPLRLPALFLMRQMFSMRRLRKTMMVITPMMLLLKGVR